MKKIFSLISMFFILLIGGCKFNLKSYGSHSNNVPSTLINTSVSDDVEDLSDLYNNCKKAVVTILNYASYYDRGQIVTSLYGTGSGFVYSYDDSYIYLYTNAHVVNVDAGYSQSYYEIVFYDGYRSYGTVSQRDASEDVAVMKVNRENQDFSVASLANSDIVAPGNSVFTLGSPLGQEYANTITRGIVSNVNVEMDTDNDKDSNSTTMYLIQIDAALNPGNSGGPLFNNKGEVIGVNTLKLMSNSSGEDVGSFNFAIPINHFVVVANSLASNGSYSRPKLGLTVIDINRMSLKERESYGISVSKGIYIESIVAGGASYGVLSSEQIIVKINNIVIDDIGDFSCELYKYKVGNKINVVTVNTSGNNKISHEIILG